MAQFKVGDEVWVRATVAETGRAGDFYPLRLVTATDGRGFWTNEGSVQLDAPTPTHDYCLGFADGYDYATNDNTSLPVLGAVSADYRKGWRGGYVHGRAEQDAANLAIVEGGE